MAFVREGMECPNCKKHITKYPIPGRMKEVSRKHGGFSVGKAAVGAVVAGPIGIAAGGLGKEKVTYQCDTCGYIIES